MYVCEAASKKVLHSFEVLIYDTKCYVDLNSHYYEETLNSHIYNLIEFYLINIFNKFISNDLISYLSSIHLICVFFFFYTDFLGVFP